MKYRMPPISNEEIIQLTQQFRKILNYKPDEPIDILWVLEHAMRVIFEKDGFDFEVKDVDSMSEHAYTDPNTGKIIIREDIYDRACRGEGRDRFTIAHEIAHYILHANPSIARYPRIYPGDDVKPYEDSEWQADAFAGEFLCPCQAIRGMTPEEVADKFGVSVQAAKKKNKKSLRCFQ